MNQYNVMAYQELVVPTATWHTNETFPTVAHTIRYQNVFCNIIFINNMPSYYEFINFTQAYTFTSLEEAINFLVEQNGTIKGLRIVA